MVEPDRLVQRTVISRGSQSKYTRLPDEMSIRHGDSAESAPQAARVENTAAARIRRLLISAMPFSKP
jgi:hypothetical protein